VWIITRSWHVVSVLAGVGDDGTGWIFNDKVSAAIRETDDSGIKNCLYCYCVGLMSYRLGLIHCLAWWHKMLLDLALVSSVHLSVVLLFGSLSLCVVTDGSLCSFVNWFVVEPGGWVFCRCRVKIMSEMNGWVEH